MRMPRVFQAPAEVCQLSEERSWRLSSRMQAPTATRTACRGGPLFSLHVNAIFLQCLQRTCEDQKNESLAEDAWLHFQSAPSPLPPWCAVRRTFIECEAAEASPQLARPHSQPPCSLNFDSDAEVVYVDL
ncbi:unnamed protein product [Effrenium voratum]|nr:unnamed protein product [Effrenium voratum]